MAPLQRACERFLIVLFLGVLAVPGVATIFGWDRDPDRSENRQLAPPPHLEWSLASLDAFPDAFTRYFEDNFAFRPRMVRWQAMLRFEGLGVSPSPGVIKGRNGWLFYADDGAMEDYATAGPLTPGELEIWRRTLQDTRDWLRAQGIAYLFVIAPDKHQIYPEYMPEDVRRRQNSRIDQVVDYLRAHSTVRVVDLRPALLEAKARERIYHKTDTHWNDRGAYIGYEQILAAIDEIPDRPIRVRNLQPIERHAFHDEDVVTSGLDLAGMIGLTSVLREDDLTLVPRQPRRARVVEPTHPDPHGIEAREATEIDDPRLPRAVVFRDSFGSALIPFLSEHFSRALYLWQYNVDPKVIAEEKPDIVIQEWVGRRLSTLLPYDPTTP